MIINYQLKRFVAPVAMAAMLLSMVGWAGSAYAAPSTPVVTSPTSPHSTTTNPITIYGTADATSTIVVSGGVSPSTTTADVSGNWSASVDLTASSTNTLSVVSIDSVGSTSAAVMLDVTHLGTTTTPDVTPPAAPVVTFPSTPHSTSTNPITVYGTAEADSSISISGGSSAANATTSSGGSWSASVGLNASSTNSLSIVAVDASGNTSATTTLSITHFNSATSVTPTSTPIISLTGDPTHTFFVCNGFVEPGFSAVDSTGATITATSSPNPFSATEPGSYTITYTATDSEGNTATTTRTVLALKCSSRGGSGGGGGSSGDTNRGIQRAAEVTPPFIGVPGNAVGLQLLQQFQVPPGQIISVAGFETLFTSNMGVGSRGPQVTALQLRLQSLGYFRGPVTGYYGPITRAAVRAFQRDHGVTMTGTVGPITRSVLNS